MLFDCTCNAIALSYRQLTTLHVAHFSLHSYSISFCNPTTVGWNLQDFAYRIPLSLHMTLPIPHCPLLTRFITPNDITLFTAYESYYYIRRPIRSLLLASATYETGVNMFTTLFALSLCFSVHIIGYCQNYSHVNNITHQHMTRVKYNTPRHDICQANVWWLHTIRYVA